MAVRQAALVSDESALEACACWRRCAIQIDDLYLFTFDGYPYLATSFQRSVDLSDTVLRVPIPYGCTLSVQGRSVNLSRLT